MELILKREIVTLRMDLILHRKKVTKGTSLILPKETNGMELEKMMKGVELTLIREKGTK